MAKHVRLHVDYDMTSLLSNIDHLNRGRCWGWAFDPKRPDDRVQLEICCDGVIIGSTIANLFREPIAKQRLGDGYCGFDVHFPVGLDLTLPHTIEIRRRSDGTQLNGSPAFLPPILGFEEGIREDLTRLLEDYAAAAMRPEHLDPVIKYLMERADALLSVRARLVAAARGNVPDLRRRWGRLMPSTAVREAAAPLAPHALVVDNVAPELSSNAGANAILDHMRALRDLGFSVSFVPSDDLWCNRADATTLSARGIECLTAPWYCSVEEVFRRHAGTIDLIYMHRVNNAARYIHLARHYCPRALILYSVLTCITCAQPVKSLLKTCRSLRRM